MIVSGIVNSMHKDYLNIQKKYEEYKIDRLCKKIKMIEACNMREWFNNLLNYMKICRNREAVMDK